MDRWVGKVAVVTGASAGIGAAIAEQLVNAGLQVVALARRKERLEELAAKLEGKKGKLIPAKLDITKQEDVLSTFEWIEKDVGPISILVNNAGAASNNTLVNGDISEWKRLMDTNFWGLAVATRQAIKCMQENNIDGHIIMMNSICGHYIVNRERLNVYSSSKYAVTAFTETLRRELTALNSRIKVTSISPGRVNTEILEASGFAQPSHASSTTVGTGPALASEDVASAVLYVLGTAPLVQISELTIRPVGEWI